MAADASKERLDDLVAESAGLDVASVSGDIPKGLRFGRRLAGIVGEPHQPRRTTAGSPAVVRSVLGLSGYRWRLISFWLLPAQLLDGAFHSVPVAQVDKHDAAAAEV
ncbi:hypothetical protein [Arthrobacter sp. ISL-48]|uniref:hypothetical protein n=1 Tax=Arthrobacter sp. ISL-48 TaxID=2819110 RepID=UPI0020361361|nr:hypothetical protein [Arthrobacter sp. ISL-48]